MSAPFGVIEIIEFQDFKAWDEWRTEAPEMLRGAHQSRVDQWILSRAALEKAFQRVGAAIDRKDLSQTEGHKSLKRNSMFTFSISHTERAAAAWVCDARLGFEIGLDIEGSEREISDKVAKRIMAPGDVSFARAIELFSAKEAAFKAIPNEFQDGIVLPKIMLSDSKFALVDSPIQGQWTQSTAKNYVCSFAWVRRSDIGA